MKIQSYEPTVSPTTPTVPEPKFATPVRGAFTNATAEGIGQIGETVGKIGNALLDHKIEVNNQKNEAYLADLDTNFRQNLQDKLLNTDNETVKINGQDVSRPKGLLNRKFGDASGVSTDFEKYYSDMRQRYLGNLGNNQKLIAQLAPRLDSQYLSAREMVIKHESTQVRQGLIKSQVSNLDQQFHDAAAITDPQALKLALGNAMQTQAHINSLSDIDPETAALKVKETAGKLTDKVTKNLLLNSGDFDAAKGLLDSVQNQINPDDYNKTMKGLIQGYNFIQRQQRTIQNTQMISNRYDYLTKLSSGMINWSNIDDEIKNVAPTDPELAQVMQNIVTSEGKYVPTNDIVNNFAFMNIAKGVLDKNSPEEASKFLVNALKGKNGGKIGLDKLGALVSVAKDHGEALKAQADPQAKEDQGIVKSVANTFGKFVAINPGKMFADWITHKQQSGATGNALKDSAKKVIKNELRNIYPALGHISVIPNKIINSDGSVDTIYEGDLGEYGDDSTRQQE